jgi:hypothetical protein
MTGLTPLEEESGWQIKMERHSRQYGFQSRSQAQTFSSFSSSSSQSMKKKNSNTWF